MWDKLKAAVEAGYYKTEESLEDQTPIPWAQKNCSDCPFFKNDICRVKGVSRNPDDHTCKYFDDANHSEAQKIIDAHASPWWDWFWGWYQDAAKTSEML